MIRADSIRLSFRGREIIRDGVLHLADGEIVGLLGRNGAGKSCLYRILLGEMKADYANIFVEGTYCKRPYAIPGLINYLPQRSIHPPAMLLSDLLRLYGASTSSLLRQLPVFADLQKRSFGSLSGGEKRLLELYLILSMPTRFSLLDEPFAGLSPLAADAAASLIKNAGESKGILISDHDYHRILELCNRNYLLALLQLVTFSSVSELRLLGYLPDPGRLGADAGG